MSSQALHRTRLDFYDDSHRRSVSQNKGTRAGTELDALQSLLAAWNTSTPKSSLVGWSSTQILPCRRNASRPQWQGVTCREFRCDPPCNSSTRVNISVVGFVFYQIYSMILRLWETHMQPIQRLCVHSCAASSNERTYKMCFVSEIWELHDNGFYGGRPDVYFSLKLEELDLSGNQLTGEYPR
uniref:Leucine-rich repeat-containing N-terminal plant-type domain-containing protein n=1 Tax=Physcomitrium patens TaxID=3218 RepID=A0A2K1KW20_PHYPA|nr:hypothetical protein PHYPA_004967 [Physcomitrium patens]